MLRHLYFFRIITNKSLITPTSRSSTLPVPGKLLVHCGSMCFHNLKKTLLNVTKLPFLALIQGTSYFYPFPKYLLRLGARCCVSQVSNFINILGIPFLYKSALHSFSLITVWLRNCVAKEYWDKSLLYNVDEIDYTIIHKKTGHL